MPDAATMRKALWLTQVFPRGSRDLLGGFLLRLAREMPARGWDVTVLAPGSANAPPAETLEGVQVARFPYRGMGRSEVAYRGEMHRRALRHPGTFVAFLRSFRGAARDMVSATRPDVMHAHWWIPTAWLAVDIARREGTPLAISLHGTDVRLLRRVPLLEPFARRVLGGAAVVLPVSGALDREAGRLGVDAGRREILPMPADSTCFRPGPDPRAPVAGRFLVAARLTRQKGVGDAVRALGALVASGLDARLEIAGDGPERARLVRLAAARGVADRVTFHGFVSADRLAELYRGATAVLLPAREEGYGLVIVEAALCGIPAVGARSGGITDLVRHGETGLLVEPEDPSALADAMRRLLLDPELAARMGRQARDSADARTADPLADRLAEIYRRLVAPAA